MTQLLIVRHGNTFETGETPRRVGLRTDLPLSSSGRKQANALQIYLESAHPNITAVFCSDLMRTKQTAQLALAYLPNITIKPLSIFNEVDYGVDENQIEDKVIARIGKQALKDWEEKSIVPNGWHIDSDAIKADLAQFSSAIVEQYPDETIMVVTSNGIARFFPDVLMSDSTWNQPLKMPTASISLFQYKNNRWHCQFWGKRPH